MSHGPDGGSGHGGGAFDHGGGHGHDNAMHSLGHGLDHHGFGQGHGGLGHGGFGGIDHGFGHQGHGGSAMYAAVNGGAHAASHYGSHAVVFVWGMGLLEGGHVVNTVSTAGPVSGHGGGHVDGPGANRQSPRDLRINDIKGARLLVAHAIGLKDLGAGVYNRMLDDVAKRVGLMRIDPRPNLKGEDSVGIDGILPWNAWGNPKSTTGPDGYEPLLRGMTDKIIHVFAIPKRDPKLNRMAVSPNEVVTLSVRLTVWHYAQTRDAEVKIEVIVSSSYVYDPFQDGKYTFYGRRTSAIEARALELIQAMFADLTAPSDRADPKPRVKYLKMVHRLPNMKHQPLDGAPVHADGVHVGDAAELEEIETEEARRIPADDRRIENEVASGAAPAPTTVTSDDDSALTGPNGNAGSTVKGPAPSSPGATVGTFEIPIDLK